MVILEITYEAQEEILSIPSGVTKSALGIDIDVNIQENAMVNIGPLFLKGDSVKMFSSASHHGYQKGRHLGNLQCSYSKSCIVA